MRVWFRSLYRKAFKTRLDTGQSRGDTEGVKAEGRAQEWKRIRAEHAAVGQSPGSQLAPELGVLMETS